MTSWDSRLSLSCKGVSGPWSMGIGVRRLADGDLLIGQIPRLAADSISLRLEGWVIAWIGCGTKRPTTKIATRL